ncbi:MAG: adenylate kinase [Alphaproteobacteria bacterium]|nr:adenylate kinase [Alphaproteobacteria bacterium]
MSNGKHIVLMAPPGGGKGTQAQILRDSLNIPHLSTGEMLRAAGRAGTEVGLQAKALIDKGCFVPDEMIISIISERLDQDDCKEGFILDGFPRTLPQAKALDTLLFEKGLRLDHVIEIQVPEDLIIQRIIGRFSCADCGAMYHDTFKPTKTFGVCDSCGGTHMIRRQDDNWVTVVSRLKTYNSITTPVLPYYEYQGLLTTIDGVGEIDVISEKLKKIILK